MDSAPMKTNSRSTAPLPVVRLTNPALEQIERSLTRQNSELDAAFALVAGLGDVSFVVNPELLEEIDTACATRPTSRGLLTTLTRC